MLAGLLFDLVVRQRRLPATEVLVGSGFTRECRLHLLEGHDRGMLPVESGQVLHGLQEFLQHAVLQRPLGEPEQVPRLVLVAVRALGDAEAFGVVR